MSTESKSEINFDTVCALLKSILSSSARSEIVAGVSKSTSFSQSLSTLGAAMRSHDFRLGAWRIPVKALDDRTRCDGFHALHDWDGNRDAFNEDFIPVDVLSFLIDKKVPTGSERRVLAIVPTTISCMSSRSWRCGSGTKGTRTTIWTDPLSSCTTCRGRTEVVNTSWRARRY